MGRSRKSMLGRPAWCLLTLWLALPVSMATAHGPAPTITEDGDLSCASGIAAWPEFCEETPCPGTDECLFTHGDEFVCVPSIADTEVLQKVPTISCCWLGEVAGDDCWTGDRRGRCVPVSGAGSICLVTADSSAFDYCGGRIEECFKSPSPDAGAWGSFFAGDCDGDGLSNATDRSVCDALDGGVPMADAGPGIDAGVNVDAGPNIDAGANVDAGANIDAGAGIDAAPGAGRDSGGGPDVEGYSLRGAGGCACNAARPSPGSGVALSAILAGVFLLARRSRRRR